MIQMIQNKYDRSGSEEVVATRLKELLSNSEFIAFLQ